MKKLSLLIICCIVFKIATAQTPDLHAITDSIEAEGKTLYRSEAASWYGTDIFLEKCKGKTGRIGGYISYDSGSGMNNIFFSKDEVPVILATMSFPYDNINPANCKLDSTERKLTDTESLLCRMRTTAINTINANKDTLFKFYNNASINPVPIVITGEKRVYVLTGPKVNGVVLFGNDYLMRFDANDHLTGTVKLHKGLIPINTKPAADNSPVVASIHTHLPEYSHYITATDICTLMLYEKQAGWGQHIVMGKDMVSIWDCKKDKLAIITLEAWNKIYGKQNQPDATKN